MVHSGKKRGNWNRLANEYRGLALVAQLKLNAFHSVTLGLKDIPELRAMSVVDGSADKLIDAIERYGEIEVERCE